MTPRSVTFAVAAAIDGGWPGSAVDPDALVDRAEFHRTSALLMRTPYAAQLPGRAAERLREHARLAALHSALLDDELRRVLAEAARRGVTPLVTKGAHLSHALYPHAHLRPRSDSDLLVEPGQRSAMAEALTACGYVTSASTTSGTLILGELHFERPLRTGVVHYIDVHWRIAAPLIFERRAPAAALMAEAEPLGPLSDHARAPALPHALVLASVHAVAHHWDELRLIWLYDIKLLADALDGRGRDRFVAFARQEGCLSITYCALQTARLYFRSASLDELIARLGSLADGSEPAAALLRHDRRGVDDLVLDLKELGWARGARMLREHVLPPPAYMRAAFAGRPLPLAYASRLLRGVWRWF